MTERISKQVALHTTGGGNVAQRLDFVRI